MTLTREYETDVFLNEEKELIIHQIDSEGHSNYIMIGSIGRMESLIKAMQNVIEEQIEEEQ